MAEFEELRLTVNLVDNASAGLTKIRTEIGLLTQSATGLTTAVNAASAGVTNLGNATNKTAPGVRTLNAEMREAGRYANELKDGFVRMGQAAQGLQSLPAIASNVRDLGLSLHGLSTSFSKVSPMAGAAVIGIGAVAIAVVGLGAAVVAYGVSVFKFAKEMDQLGKTARQIGVSFAELKYAQDEAKKFGQSAESITRSFQAVGDAQFNLSKNNSTLRSRLIGMGVEANWVNQLAAMDPNKARNAVITYGKALERQLLEAGVAKNVARAMMNQFGAEFGLSAEDMDMPLLKDPDPKTKAELERIGELSKQIGIVWGEIGAIWDDFSTEILAMGLPIVLDALTTLQAQLPALLGELKTELKGLIEALPGFIATIPETLTSIRETMTDVANIFRDVKGLYDTITGKTSELTKDGKSADTDENGEGALQQQDREKLERSDLAKDAGVGDIGAPPAASPRAADPFPNANRAGRLSRPALPPQQRPGGIQLQSYQGGANDNNPLLVRASFTSEELVDETGKNTTQAEKLTQQLEKLNAFFDRSSTGGGAGGGGGGIQNAAYHPDGGGGSSSGGGGGGGGFHSGGGYTVMPNSSNGSASPPQTSSSSTTAAPPVQPGAPAVPPAAAGAGNGGAGGAVSKTDANSIFGGGNIAGVGTVPKAMTGGTVAGVGGGATVAGAGGVTHDGSGRMVEPQIAQSMAYAGAMAGVKTNIAHGDEGGHARHRSGASAGDIDLYDPVTNRKLDANNPEDKVKMAAYIEHAAASGSTGIGFGGEKGGYMGPSRLHVGGGAAAVWGAGGHGVNAPQWVKDAYARGRAKQVSPEQQKAAIARAGTGGGGAATETAAAQVGGYPLSLVRGGAGGGIGLDASMASQPDRGALDRGALTSSQTVRADGSVKVDVGPSAQQLAESARERLFKDTPMQKQEAGQLTNIGPNAHETAKQYMASR